MRRKPIEMGKCAGNVVLKSAKAHSIRVRVMVSVMVMVMVMVRVRVRVRVKVRDRVEESVLFSERCHQP